MPAKKKTPQQGITEQNIDDFEGLNILDRPESCKLGELQKATNVDIDRNTDARRRKGRTRIYAGKIHSLWSDRSTALFWEDGFLKRLNPDNTSTSLVGGLKEEICYLKIFNKVFFSDEIKNGITDFRTVWNWGVEPPPKPLLTETSGLMPPGRYRCALVYQKNDGQESGALDSVSIDITLGGIIVSNILPSVDPLVTWINIYLSTASGETLHLAGRVANGTSSFTYGGTTVEFKLPIKTQHLTPPPPGHNIQYYNGQIYIAFDNILFWTEPGLYELTNLAHNYIMFPSRITLLAPVKDGIWLSYGDEIIFWAVSNPDKDKGGKRIVKAIWGVLEGSQAIIDLPQGEEKIWGWMFMAKDGIHLALDGGVLKNLTWSRWMPPDFKGRGAALLREEMGLNQYICGLKTI